MVAPRRVSALALPLVGVLTLHASPAEMGILTALVWAPNLVFALHAGALADRLGRRRRVMIASDLGRAAPAEPPPEPPEPGHLTAGVRYVRGSPVVFYELASCAMVNFFNFAYFAIFLLYATRELHVRAGTLGIVLGVAAIGSLIGAVVTRRIADRIGVGPAFCVGIVLFPAPLILVPLAGGPHALVLACLFLAEFGSGVGVMILDI